MSIVIVTVITIVYLVALFSVCTFAQRRQKEKEKEGGTGNFLLAGKSLPTAIVACMMAGAGIGTINTTGVAEQVQTAGLSGCCVGFAGAVALIFLGIVGAKRMRALPYGTMPSMAMPSMAMAYCGWGTRYLLSVGGTVIALAVAALQFIGGGAMLSAMFPGVISYHMGIVITAVVFFAISFVGGFLGAALSNVINMIIMYVGLGLVLIVALTNLGGIGHLNEMVNAIPEATTSGAPWLSITGGLGFATFVSYFATEIPNRFSTQSNTAQIFAAKDGKAGRNGLIIGALMMIPITVISTIIGLIARVQFPDLSVKTQAMAQVVLSVNPVVSGLGMAALWAVNVSTGIALMMTCAQLICGDLLAPLNNKVKMTEKKQAVQGRITLTVVLVICLVMAFLMTGIVKTIMTMCCITPAMFFLFLAILFFPKLLKKSTGVVTLAASYIFFLLWLLVPGLKAAFPNPVYPEWVIAIVLFALCAICDKRTVKVPDGDAEAIAAAVHPGR